MSGTTSFKDRKTPGVYVKEFSSIPPTVVGVQTAVPVFVGSTETATNPTTRQSMFLEAIPIGSPAEYTAYFGGGAGVLPATIDLFYRNGGINCYVISNGTSMPTKGDLLAGLDVANTTTGVTILVVPEACLLPEADYAEVAVAMLTQAGTLQDRMAILDLPGALDPAQWTKPGLSAQAAAFFRAIAPAKMYFGYGAAYAPAVRLSNGTALPPSGIMAGIWTQNDNLNSVWNAPANLALAGVDGPAVLLNEADQGHYNAPPNGNAIDILREFAGRGTVVWGARTLDGNSNDNRYIQVRRTLIYIEQSIELALQQFVFAANDASTWATAIASVSNFLTPIWQSGGLMGATPEEAFTVQCGVPQTMTAQDVLNGYMIVSVTLQMVHPAEFIELTFRQKMNTP